MSAADACTLLRLLLAPAFAVALARGAGATGFVSVLPVAICVVAMATDFADGRLARRRGVASELGRLFDHGADALFLFPGLFVLASLGRLPFAMPAAASVAFALYVIDGVRRGGGVATVLLTPSRSGALAGIANYGVAIAGAIAVACRVPHLDGVLYCGAAVVAVMNLVAAADRAQTMVRASRPAPA